MVCGWWRALLALVLLLGCALGAHAARPVPTVRVESMWAYGDVVTDSTTLDSKQNNLRIYCSTVEGVPASELDFLFMLEGYDTEWFAPFAEGWCFYTDLPPGRYVFRAKCRWKGGEWGAEVRHPFEIVCPWWRTWWARVLWTLLGAAVLVYLFFLVRERIRLHNRLRVEEASQEFLREFVLEAARSFHAPLSIIRSIAEKQHLNLANPLSKADIQHLRNSSHQMMEIAESLIEFRPADSSAPYFKAEDVVELQGVPLNTLTVLLVVEDEGLADLIERDLRRVFKVRRTNGEQALAVARELRPNAVVIDAAVGDVNPFDLPQQLKAIAPAVVVLLSDFLTSKTILRAVRSEADDFVRKPFNSQYLTAIIVKRLRQAARLVPAEDVDADAPNATDGLQQAVAVDAASALSEPRPRATEAPMQTSAPAAMCILEDRQDKLFLEQLENVVGAHLAEEHFDVNQLAGYLKVSRSKLSLRMKSLLGVTPSDYIRSRRLEHAAMLLRTTDLTIQEVMFSVGMSDPNSFHRRFKLKYGMTPNAYRK